MPSLHEIDLNLLIYFDVLMDECSVTKAAKRVGLSQPSMSNSLNRLRSLFDDPLLVRTSQGMQPTEKAQELKPKIKRVVANVKSVIQPTYQFNPQTSQRLFRIAVSDYAESILMGNVCSELIKQAPHVGIDLLTPDTIRFEDVEQGNVDLVISRFDQLPMSLHTTQLWQDPFSCIMSKQNPLAQQFDLEHYLKAKHIWVRKTDIDSLHSNQSAEDIRQSSLVDTALAQLNKRRTISIYTRNYSSAIRHIQQNDLIATIPSKSSLIIDNMNQYAIFPAPFAIPPMQLKMTWGSLLHHNQPHRWLRSLIKQVALDTMHST